MTDYYGIAILIGTCIGLFIGLVLGDLLTRPKPVTTRVVRRALQMFLADPGTTDPTIRQVAERAIRRCDFLLNDTEDQ